MALPPPPKEEEVNEDWMGTYADAVTLLMAFFVLFFSFSRVDIDIFDQVAKGLSASLAKETKESSAETLRESIKDQIVSNGASEVIKMSNDSQGNITLEFDGGAFFKPASSDLQEQAIPVLKGIVEELSNPIYQQFNISVEGHTDDGQISNARYPSNWELSTGRASTVVRFFADAKAAASAANPDGEPLFARNRLRAIGYADTQPKLPNRDLNGVAIRENQAVNRRVVLRISRKPIYEHVRVPTFRRGSTETDADPAKGKK
jgi:chemotaxis protein MotB